MNYSEQYDVKEQPWGTFISYTKEGKELVTALTEDVCRRMTETYLYWQEHGFPETQTTHESYVGGKL